MIKEKCFTKEWIDSFKEKKEHKAIQLPVLEKMIYAFHLLETLRTLGLDFVFKGGTCLTLLLKEGNRFSIDIDIICSTAREELEKILDTVVKNSNFTSVALDENRSYKAGVPKAHYDFEFNSVYDPNAPGKLLLDILFENPIYPQIIEVPIATRWFETENDITVKMPSVDSITGDKITAFAPNTIGIPYYKHNVSFALEICKQLFDLSKLFPEISSMEVVNESFQSFTKEEIGYRKNDPDFIKKETTPEKALQDTIDTCLLITRRTANKEEPFRTQFADLDIGIRALGTNFLMSGNFRIEDAVTASAQVAHLATKLLVGDLSPVAYYTGEDIKTLIIADPDWVFLNKLKKQPDKSAFYYWFQTIRLLTKENSRSK